MRGKKTLLVVRIKLIERLLKLAGFDQISGHWIYHPSIHKDSIVIDLGANKAEFSKQIFKKYQTICFAIEPDKDLYNTITDKHIVKFKFAIAKVNGPINFYVSNNQEAGSVIENFENKWGSKGTDIVEGVTWNSLIDKLNLENKLISVVKVDIEGSELDLIESFTSENISAVQQITVEFHDWLNRTLHERTLNAIKKLTLLNFITITSTPDHSWPVEILFLNKKLVRFIFLKKQS